MNQYGSVRLILGCPAFWKKNPVAIPQSAPGGPNPAASYFSGPFRNLSGPSGRNCSVFCSVGLFDGTMRKPSFFTVKSVDGCVRHFGKKTRWTGESRRGWRLGCRDTPRKGPLGSPTGDVWTNSIPNVWFFFRPALLY